MKLTVFDLVATLLSIIVGDFGRSLFLRVMNPCWFWDLELTFPKYPDFKVAENILHLVNNQGILFFMSVLPILPIFDNKRVGNTEFYLITIYISKVPYFRNDLDGIIHGSRVTCD